MAFKDIHKLKKIQEVQKENIETDYLVIGHDVFAISIFRDLINKFGDDKVRLLSQEKFELKDLSPKGPSGIRGEANQNYLKANFDSSIYNEINEVSQFYKDMQWKPFGGRSKPEALKFNEDHFTTSRMDLNYQEVFPFIKEEGFLNWLNEKTYGVRIKSILKKDERFFVECVNGTEFSAKYLICGLAPFEYLNFYKNKNELSSEFIQFCEGTTSPSALYVKLEFSKPLTDLKETLFIPLSYTHDWGHLIGEFKSNDRLQSCDFVHYLDKDQTTEEDISRIIRHLKKSLEKIFQQPKNLPVKEYISIEDSSGCLKIDDELFLQIKSTLSNLYFVGNSAPIEAISMQAAFAYSRSEMNYEVRALASLKEITKSLLD